MLRKTNSGPLAPSVLITPKSKKYPAPSDRIEANAKGKEDPFHAMADQDYDEKMRAFLNELIGALERKEDKIFLIKFIEDFLNNSVGHALHITNRQKLRVALRYLREEGGEENALNYLKKK